MWDLNLLLNLLLCDHWNLLLNLLLCDHWNLCDLLYLRSDISRYLRSDTGFFEQGLSDFCRYDSVVYEVVYDFNVFADVHIEYDLAEGSHNRALQFLACTDAR